MKKKIFTTVTVCISLLPFMSLFAWSDPTGTPPANNTYEPLNAGGTAQSKTAGLLLNSSGATNGLIVQYGNVGINTVSPSYKLDVQGSTGINGNLYFSQLGQGAVGVYDPTKTQAVWSMGPAYTLPVAGGTTNYGTLYGLGWSYNPDYGGAGNNPQSKPGLQHQLLLMYNGVTQTAIGQGIWTNGSLTTTGAVTANSQVVACTSSVCSYLRYAGDNNNYLRGNTYLAGTLIDEDNAAFYLNPSSASVVNDLQATRIFDRDNNGYYLDPSGTSNLGYTAFAGGQSNGIFYVTTGGMWVQNGTSYFDGYMWLRGPGTGGGSGVLQVDKEVSIGAHVAVGGGGTFYLYGDGSYWGSWSSASDMRLKKNIEPLPNALEKIKQLKGVSFDWKESGKHSIGLIAQDVEKVYPDLVSTDSKTGMKTVEYQNLVAPLIEAIKEQQKEIEALKAEIKALH